MFRHVQEPLPPGRSVGVRVTLHRDGVGPLSNADVLGAWRSDESFRAFFIGVLAGSSLKAYRWETPGMITATLTRPFEFVLVDEPSLVGVDADPSPVAVHIEGAGDGVVRFAHLRGDATLVVPREIGPRSAYGHFAAFTRNAPIEQQHELWKNVGAAMLARVGDRPVWLSTAGLGVPWLHVRLDDRPKYYAYAPYRTVESRDS
jgi:hypothetical protein